MPTNHSNQTSNIKPIDAHGQGTLFSLRELSEAGMSQESLRRLQRNHLDQIAIDPVTEKEIVAAWDGRDPLRLDLDRDPHSTIPFKTNNPYLQQTPIVGLAQELELKTIRKDAEKNVPYPKWLKDATHREPERACINNRAASSSTLESFFNDLKGMFFTLPGTRYMQERFGLQADPEFLRGFQHNLRIVLTSPDLMNAIDSVLGIWGRTDCTRFMDHLYQHRPVTQLSRILSMVAETLDQIGEKGGLALPIECRQRLDFTNLDKLLSLYRTIKGLNEPQRSFSGELGTEIPNLRLKDFYGTDGRLSDPRDINQANFAMTWPQLQVIFRDKLGIDFGLELPVDGGQLFSFLKSHYGELPRRIDRFSQRDPSATEAKEALKTDQEAIKKIMLAVCEYNLSRISNREDLNQLLDAIEKRVAYFDYLTTFAAISISAVKNRECNFTFARPFAAQESPPTSLVARNLRQPTTPPGLFRKPEISNDTVFSNDGAQENVRVVTAPNNAGKTHFFVDTITKSRVQVGMSGVAHAREYRYFPDGRVVIPTVTADISTKGGAFVASVKNLQVAHRRAKPTSQDYMIADEIGAGLANEGGEEQAIGSYLREIVSRNLHLCYLGHNRKLISDLASNNLPGVVIVNAPIYFDEHGKPSPTFRFQRGLPDWPNHERNVQYLLSSTKQLTWFPNYKFEPLVSFEHVLPRAVVMPPVDKLRYIWKDRKPLRESSNSYRTFVPEAKDFSPDFCELRLPLDIANTESFLALVTMLKGVKFEWVGLPTEREAVFQPEFKGVNDIRREDRLNSKRVVNDNAIQVGNLSEMLRAYLSMFITEEGRSAFESHFGKQVSAQEASQTHHNINQLLQNPDALESIDILLRTWQQLRCRTLKTLGEDGKSDISKLHERAYASKAIIDALEVITDQLGLTIPGKAADPIYFEDYGRILYLLNADYYLSPGSGHGVQFSRVPEVSMSDFLQGDEFRRLRDSQAPSYYSSLFKSASLLLTMQDGQVLRLELPVSTPQLQVLQSQLGSGMPSGVGQNDRAAFSDWVNLPIGKQHELITATLRYNLAAIAEHPAISKLFETIDARIRYFDYLAVLTSKAVHAVTERGASLCAPQMLNAEADNCASVTAQGLIHPFKEVDVEGEEIPNDLNSDVRGQVVAGPCSGGKSYFFVRTCIANRIAAGLGDVIFADSYAYDPGGRALFPVIPSEVSKHGSAFVSTIRATIRAFSEDAPTKHDHLIFDEFGGGVSDEGGELEVARDLLQELEERGLTYSYITHNGHVVDRFSDLALSSAQLLHAGIGIDQAGKPTLTYRHRLGAPNWDLYAAHITNLLKIHKPGYWISDEDP